MHAVWDKGRQQRNGAALYHVIGLSLRPPDPLQPCREVVSKPIIAESTGASSRK
jgi:hypothetical protein